MTRKLLAVVVAGSLASGCTILLPGITSRAQGSAAPGDVKTEQRHRDNTALALVAGLAIDAVVLAAGLSFKDKLDHSGD